TGVRFSDSATELQSSPARIGLHLRSFLQNRFHLAKTAIGLRQRRAGRRNVVENESAFVHHGHESGTHIFKCDKAEQEKRNQKHNYEPRLTEKALHLLSINFVHTA